MNLDKTQLKTLITIAKPSEMLVLTTNNLDKNSYKNCQKAIESFLKKTEDYVITIIKR